MPRLPAVALAALLALPCAALAQGETAAPPATTESKPATPVELDPKVQAAIQRAVDKAKEEVRNEVRAELQGAQSAAEFMGNVKDEPKLQLFELDGYFRVRGQVLDRLYLRGAPDASGYSYYPKAPHGPWLSDANMRLRLEPTINASETVRVRMQLDVLDNYLLGSSTSQAYDSPYSPYPIPFYGSTRTTSQNDPTQDRPLIIPKRVWGEVQTPVGLLTFGRQPSAWGLGILANAGSAIDSDFGDTVDRLQFALPPLGTPLGSLVIVPMVDFDITGVSHTDPHFGAGVGQPIDADQTDDAITMALKVARLDTEDEIRRKLEAHHSSENFGVYYNWRSQQNTYPAWQELGYLGDYTYKTDGTDQAFSKRQAWAHIGSLWYRHLSEKWRIEGEVVGVYGHVGNAVIIRDNPLAATIDQAATSQLAQSIGIQQWGLALQTEYKKSSALSFGFEVAAASGDSAPGFGNMPDRLQSSTGLNPGALPSYGSIEGPQWGRPGDHSINNYRFNPAYTPDLILYRRILGQVTDSWYLRPSIRWDIVPGVTLDGVAIYSQAMDSKSTPSSSSVTPGDATSELASKGHSPLGLELDTKLTVKPGNGFQAWGDIGMLKPLSGFGPGTSLAWVFEFGLAATF